MTMPIDLVLVRHGESEGNLANERSRKGDDRAFTEEFKNRSSSMWRLTDKGREQAIIAGEWIRQNIGKRFDRYYTSEYARAIETAAYLNFPDALWHREVYLRERDHGQLDVMSHEERNRLFGDELKRRERDGIYWAPPGGESKANAMLRVDRVSDTLQRECSESRVLIVEHGEIMMLHAIRLERINQKQFHGIIRSDNPHDKIYNCQIVHYSRVDPDNGTSYPYYLWKRSVCPWDLSRSRNIWQKIERKKYSNVELLAEVEEIPQLVT